MTIYVLKGRHKNNFILMLFVLFIDDLLKFSFEGTRLQIA